VEEAFSGRLAETGPGVTRPLPDRFRPMAAAIAGRAARPRLATGPESRDALRASGAKAATIGRTVYLPRYPTSSPRSLGVLGHEIAHVTDQRHRSPQGHPDRATQSSAAPAGPARARSAPTPPSWPRFFGGIGSLADRGEALATSVGNDVERAAAGAGSDSLLAATGRPGRVAERLAAGARDLPVGGFGGLALGAVLDAARRAALETVESAGPRASRVAATVEADGAIGSGEPGGLGSGRPDPATGEMASLAGGRPGEAAEGVDGEPATVDPTVRGVLGESASAAGDSYSQLSELLEQVEERLLVEIERRGGRYAGVF
jgi:hypothetical protein